MQFTKYNFGIKIVVDM